MRLNKSQKRLKISGSQLKALQGRIKNRALAEEDWDVVMAMTETVECLAQALAEKETAIARLCKYLLGAPTETARNVLKGKKSEASASPSRRNGKKPLKKSRGTAKIQPPHTRAGKKSASSILPYGRETGAPAARGARSMSLHCLPSLFISSARRPSNPQCTSARGCVATSAGRSSLPSFPLTWARPSMMSRPRPWWPC